MFAQTSYCASWLGELRPFSAAQHLHGSCLCEPEGAACVRTNGASAWAPAVPQPSRHNSASQSQVG